MSDDIRLKEKYFGSEKKISRKRLEDIFISTTFESDEDCVKMGLVYLISNFIFTKHKDKLVEDVHFQIADSKDFNNYPLEKSSRSPHYEDLETNVFGSKKIKGFSLSDVEKKRLSVGWILDSSDKIGQDDDDFEDPPVRVTQVTETSTSTLQPKSQTEFFQSSINELKQRIEKIEETQNAILKEMPSLSKDIKDHITLKFGGLVSLLVEIREKMGKLAVAFQSSPGDILFDLPEDQMEGVVVGEGTNDKEKQTVVCMSSLDT
ncbi:hypothetical protein PanWU01x14_229370 [Parasponia andersonii]|uniref:DUF1985 domain-containing protein n=1 Tax=Parasponia andersonii TaxID=3476 RepID=A0A2P5BLF0_PARAD|nr:hypothetical protein PanWU01x14_229370 [Parasponia andersonii]